MKICSAKEMAQLEAKSIEDGASSKDYMKLAGRSIAELIEEQIIENELEKRVVLFVGKGNNGGDAYVAGVNLLKEKYEVRAYTLFDEDEVSELNAHYRKKFIRNHGVVEKVNSADEIHISPNEMVVDGLVGTGFSGGAEGLLKEVIDQINQFNCHVISIDIPSGVDGNTGEVKTSAVHANVTGYLGLPKKGFFVNDGFNHVGYLTQLDFGMEPSYFEQVKPYMRLVESHTLIHSLPKVPRVRHKYQAGYVLGFAANQQMTGAAALATIASLRAGGGIVRLFTEPETVCHNLAAEVIHDHWILDDLSNVKSELSRAKSLFIGPGMGRSEKVKELLQMVLKEAKIPSILDADALYLLKGEDLSQFDQPLILTPHRKECRELIGVDKECDDDHFIEQAQAFVQKHNVILVLKGAPTIIFQPNEVPTLFTHGSPGMATAGSGDVLTGVIAAFAAQGLSPFEAASVGVTLHGISGEIATLEKTHYCVIASDLIDYLPDAFSQLLSIRIASKG